MTKLILKEKILPVPSTSPETDISNLYKIWFSKPQSYKTMNVWPNFYAGMMIRAGSILKESELKTIAGDWLRRCQTAASHIR